MQRHIRIGLAVVLLLMLSLVTGCRDSTTCYVAVDVSGSMSGRREACLKLIYMLVQYELPPNATLSLWRFAQQSEKIWEGNVVSVDQIVDIVRRQLIASTHGVGTYPGSLLEGIAEDMGRRSGGACGLLLIWDGENSGPALDTAIGSLAAAEGLRAVWVAGVPAAERLNVERQLVPLGNRAVVTGLEDSQTGLSLMSPN